jgi:Zn-dependent membrane protease YugP
VFYFDPLYFVFALPALLLALIAQWRVQAAINKYSRVPTGRGATGARVARAILDGYGLRDVPVERTEGFLSDHYDPLHRTLRLSPGVYDTPSVAAVGIAAHETGHALQHAEGYWPLGPSRPGRPSCPSCSSARISARSCSCSGFFYN